MKLKIRKIYFLALLCSMLVLTACNKSSDTQNQEQTDVTVTDEFVPEITEFENCYLGDLPDGYNSECELIELGNYKDISVSDEYVMSCVNSQYEECLEIYEEDINYKIENTYGKGVDVNDIPNEFWKHSYRT